MSVPVTLRALYSKLEQITSSPLSPSCRAATEAENEHSTPSITTVTNANTTLSQSAAVPEDNFTVSDSACYAMSVAKSELLSEINTSPAVNPYPFTPVGVFPHWMTNNGHLSKLI